MLVTNTEIIQTTGNYMKIFLSRPIIAVLVCMTTFQSYGSWPGSDYDACW